MERGKKMSKRTSTSENPLCAVYASPWRKSINAIPTGKQLARTPPVPESKRNSLTIPRTLENGLCSENATKTSNCETQPQQQHIREKRKPLRRPSTISATVQVEEMSADRFITGMQGYQWTPADLEFVELTKNERQYQQLKRELNMMLVQLKDERQRCDMSLAVRDKVQADLAEITTFNMTVQMARGFLCRELDTAFVEALDPISVLAQIRVANVQQATQEERSKRAVLEKRLAELQELSVAGEQRLKEMESWRGRILQKQANVANLEKELSDLKSKLSQTEEMLTAKQSQVAAVKTSKPIEDAGEVDMTKVIRRSERIARRKDNFLEREAVLKKICALK